MPRFNAKLMQKKALILVGFILTFTMFYNMVSAYMLYNFDKQQKWAAEVSETSQSKFHIIKLNASLYSFVEDSDFEQVNQDVIVGEKSFHVFKKRIKDNVLELYVLNNVNESAMNVKLAKLAKVSFADDSDLSTSPLKKLLKLISFDYIFNKEFTIKNNVAQNLCASLYFNTTHNVKNGHTSLPFSPPKFIV